MARILIGIVAVVASFMLVDSLTCNKCPFSVAGFCLSLDEVTCSSNSSVCYKGTSTFPSLTSFSGFSKQGCQDNSTGCNTTTSATLLGVTYETKISCCSTDKCNPVDASGAAPSTRMTLTTAIGATVLASMWSMM